MRVLATDLDGTFLGGSLQDRNHLYQLIRSFEGELLLVFVTGRALENVRPLLADETIPRPHYVIADVGATIYHGDTLLPVEPIDGELASRWIGDERVLAVIPQNLVLERQQQTQNRRCSFYTDHPHVAELVREAVRPLGCTALYSGNRYLDVLPIGVTKGSTLKRLIDHLGIDPAQVLVAGDSMNDLSMFEDSPYLAAVMGGSEPALIAETRHRERTHHASRQGAGGILEAFQALSFLPDRLRSVERRGDAELVIVYHRQPFDEYCDQGVWKRREPASPNGILPTLLGLFSQGYEGSWVAWSIGGDTDQRKDDSLTRLTFARVLLRKEDVDLFYRRFSKEALWPVLHGFIERAEFNHRHWQHFIDINQRFAEVAAAEAAEGALVWIHDYNLWLVPKYLRELRDDVRIAFFHHTPFPPADVFNVLPWSREIIASLLSCDYVGFHIDHYCENFLDVVHRHALVKPRSLSLGAHPVGVDLERVQKSIRSSTCQNACNTLRAALAGLKVIVSAERFDYMKGPLQKLRAYERFLTLYPAWREKITFINICVPPADGMSVYDEMRSQVEQAVGHIDGKFSTTSWSPLIFIFRPLPFEMLAAYLSMADVAWITPLRDGLNLVAKEYVAIQSELEKSGVLIISEFAGCSVELSSALLTNPYDVHEMAGTLYRALEMAPYERRERMRQLARVVRQHDVHHWAQGFLHAAHAEWTKGARQCAL